MEPLPPAVAEKLGFYVYAYIDPRDAQPFYVGKGQGSRVLAHLNDAAETRKVRRIAEIRAAGDEPLIHIIVHGLPSEEAALRIEAAIIDTLGIANLTNEMRGWESGSVGRMPLTELVALYGAQPTDVTDPSIVIRVNRLYRFGMSSEELYEATRGVWKLGERRNRAKFALAVFHGVVREVFSIESWHPAGSTLYRFRAAGVHRPGRWEFIGSIADETVRSRYLGKSVQHHFRKGVQTPILYVGGA